jgi:Na+/H+-dicarboxylate symporter
MFSLEIPKLVSNDVALISGVFFGLSLGIYKNNITLKIATKFDKFTKLFFRTLLPMLPFFIIGAALKLQHDDILKSIYRQYLPVLSTFILSSYGLVLIQLFVLAKFRFLKVAEYIKNTFPAIIAAFSSASSAVALPLSIKAAEKNIDDKANAGIIAPSIVNIHLVGDCFFIPMIAIAVMISFGIEFPTLSQYILFSLFFVLAKFAVAAIPGAGVLVMIPVMQKYLGLSSDMLMLVTALYILFDPLITVCNVAGNASLAIIFDKITRIWKKRST